MRTILYRSQDQLVDEMNRISIERIPFTVATGLTMNDTLPAVLLALVHGDFPTMYARKYVFRQRTDRAGFIFIDALLPEDDPKK